MHQIGVHMHAMSWDEHHDDLLIHFTKCLRFASEDPAARVAYRDAFTQLRSRLVMYPQAGQCPSTAFESVAGTARQLAASCLPLAIALIMHLYPLCALQCVPIPLLSVARLQRAMMLRMIRTRSRVLANAGSDRAAGAHVPLVATPCADGIRVEGTYEYMSLASVADMVFFKAQLANTTNTVLCAADLSGDSVRIGDWKFSGSMRLSDTASVTFTQHRIPHERYIVVSAEANVRCISDYQRCWFHLFLVEIHLARLERLRRIWKLGFSAEHAVSLNELFRLREYSLRLLDEFSTRGGRLEALLSTTAAMKLRTSMLVRSTKAALDGLKACTSNHGERIRSDAAELSFISAQPTADHEILRRIGVPCAAVV